jgi:hypothetical protein
MPGHPRHHCQGRLCSFRELRAQSAVVPWGWTVWLVRASSRPSGPRPASGSPCVRVRTCGYQAAGRVRLPRRAGSGAQATAPEGTGNGAEIPADTTTPSDTVTREFQHPGLLHTEADLIRMRDKLAKGEQPWSDAWGPHDGPDLKVGSAIIALLADRSIERAQYSARFWERQLALQQAHSPHYPRAHSMINERSQAFAGFFSGASQGRVRRTSGGCHQRLREPSGTVAGRSGSCRVSHGDALCGSAP